MASTTELAIERDQIEERLRRKEYDPQARLAEIDAELDHRYAEHAERQAARQARIEELLAAYEPARARADTLTGDLADALEQASGLRAQLKELHAAPAGVHERSARRDPETLKLAEIGDLRLRLRSALTRDY